MKDLVFGLVGSYLLVLACVVEPTTSVDSLRVAAEERICEVITTVNASATSGWLCADNAKAVASEVESHVDEVGTGSVELVSTESYTVNVITVSPCISRA